MRMGSRNRNGTRRCRRVCGAHYAQASGLADRALPPKLISHPRQLNPIPLVHRQPHPIQRLAVQHHIRRPIHLGSDIALAPLGQRRHGNARAADGGDDFGQHDVFTGTTDGAQVGAGGVGLLFGRWKVCRDGGGVFAMIRMRGLGRQAAGFAGVHEVAFGHEGVHQKADAAFADVEQITALQHLAAHFEAVDLGAIGAAQVFNHDDANLLLIGERDMLAADRHVGQHDVVGGTAPQGGPGLRQHVVLDHHTI